MTDDQKRALEQVAASHGWDTMPLADLGVLTWAVFHYYAMRLSRR